MRGVALFVVFWGCVTGLMGCLKKSDEGQSEVDNHFTKVGMLSAEDGFLKPENTRIGVYFNGKMQFCPAETSIAEFHVKPMEHHAFFNKLWGFVCINKEATTAKLYDAQNHTDPAAAIDLLRDRDVNPNESKDDTYRILDGFSSEYIDRHDAGAGGQPQVASRLPLATLNPFKGSWWWPKISEYGATEIYSLQLARLDGDANSGATGLVYVKNLFSAPLTETWRLLRKNAEGLDKSQVNQNAQADQGVAQATGTSPTSQIPASEGREIARMWSQPGLYGWNIVDFSAEKNVKVDRRVLIMLPFYQELRKRAP